MRKHPTDGVFRWGHSGESVMGEPAKKLNPPKDKPPYANSAKGHGVKGKKK